MHHFSTILLSIKDFMLPTHWIWYVPLPKWRAYLYIKSTTTKWVYTLVSLPHWQREWCPHRPLSHLTSQTMLNQICASIKLHFSPKSMVCVCVCVLIYVWKCVQYINLTCTICCGRCASGQLFSGRFNFISFISYIHNYYKYIFNADKYIIFLCRIAI